MPLNPVRIVKSWFRNNYVEPEHWDELVNKFGAFATETLANLKQIGLDMGGATYDFNNVGKATQSNNVIARIDVLESASLIGISNLGLDLSVAGTISLTAGDGTALSSSNTAQVAINDSSSGGQIKVYTLSATQSVTLTGAHWGLGTLGDFNDVPLWIILADDSGTLRLGVGAEGGRQTIGTSDDETVATSVTTRSKVLMASALSGTANVLNIGWVNANFDDTGNGGGEDYWTVQTSQGDVNLGVVPGYQEVTSLRF